MERFDRLQDTHGLLGKNYLPWNKPIAGAISVFPEITIT